MKITKQKIKDFYEDHKVEVMTISLIIGGIVIARILKPERKEVEVLPEWARKWRSKCDTDNLLYDSGLPIFADDSMMVIYDDAFANDEVMNQFKEDGYTIIERA